DQFKSGEYNTTFIDETPELFVFPKRKDRGTKMLTYIGHTTINGFEGMEKKKKPIFTKPTEPKISKLEDLPAGTKQMLDERGPEGLAAWLKEQNEVMLTDNIQGCTSIIISDKGTYEGLTQNCRTDSTLIA